MGGVADPIARSSQESRPLARHQARPLRRCHSPPNEDALRGGDQSKRRLEPATPSTQSFTSRGSASCIVPPAPALLALPGVGTDVAGALLVAAGDNPERLSSEAAFARLCGVAPLPASSGKTDRYRLNRGGDRIANNAMWRIVLVRMSFNSRTRNYVDRRTNEGLSKKEIIRCLKRYVARDVYRRLVGVDNQ